jgi:superfamily II DNA or RNA helicase/HKD family nuclease
MPKLKFGLYDRLLYDNEIDEVAELKRQGRASIDLPSAENSRNYLISELVSRIPELLDQISSKEENETEKAKSELKLISEILKQARLISKAEDELDSIASPPQLLRSIHAPNLPGIFPITGLRNSWLFSSSKSEPALLTELISELQAVDTVDILVSFITWSGVRKIYDILKNITSIDAQGSSKTKFRIITTTYIGATDARAVNALAELPNVELKISLDGRRTRLHAKAWIFKRSTGFGTAYIGSANLSESALVSGIEWTIKIAQATSNQVYQNAEAHFETLWNDPEFQKYDPHNENHRDALNKALHEQKYANNGAFNVEIIANQTWFELKPKFYQQEMLDRLQSERDQNRNRNLVVAATGTGKTVVAAFDYERICRQEGGQPKLLFVAHRIQILKQAISTFRQILRDSNFGELMDGNNEPSQYGHLFATINTINGRDLIAKLGQNYWLMVIIDEAHHLPAQSFDKFASSIKPKILLGLTATPERTDGIPIGKYFDSRPDGSPAVSLRLWDALDQQLLAPFEYYATHDDTDLRSINWRQLNVDSQLSNIISSNEMRALAVYQAVERYSSNITELKSIGFCVSVKHAEFMAQFFNSRHIPSKSLTGEQSELERNTIIKELTSGLIKIIFTCDLFNEGVDIPEINTLLLLRPTQSPVLFQQQIGRGLRLNPGKECCLVLDFIGNYAEEFRFDILFRSLTGQTRKGIKESVEVGFGLLPPGCHIQFDKVSRSRVLDSLKKSLKLNARRLTAELAAWASTKSHDQIKLKNFLIENQIEIEDIYSGNHSWVEFKRRIGLPTPPPGINENVLSKRLGSLLYVDDRELLKAWKYAIQNEKIDATRIQMLAYQMITSGTVSPSQFLDDLSAHPAVKEELIELIEWQINQSGKAYAQFQDAPAYWPISLHNRYTRSDILTAVGYRNAKIRPDFREGCLLLENIKTEMMFVTLDKSKGFHESVQYHDYAISPNLFHWQTQNRASPSNKTGQRYIESINGNGWRFFLFVRENSDCAFVALGEVVLNEFNGERPIEVTWLLKQSMTAELFRRLSIIRST